MHVELPSRCETGRIRCRRQVGYEKTSTRLEFNYIPFSYIAYTVLLESDVNLDEDDGELTLEAVEL